MGNEPHDDHFWVFGYGSLMWNPGFEFEAVHRALMTGVHRAPCIFSWVHRGTKERPGIVLGLDRGGACVGKAFRVSSERHGETLDYLRDRELVTNVYVEVQRTTKLDTGVNVRTTTYIVDQNHDQYAGRLTPEKLIAQIRGAVGKSGPNEAYIIDTTEHLREMGIRDSLLEKITAILRNDQRSPSIR